MDYIERTLKSKIQQSLTGNKVILVYGARRVGKTVLIKKIEEEFSGKSLWLNGEDMTSLRILEERSIANYRRLLQGIELLLIDEAHQIPDIGRKLKLMADEVPGIRIIASGSSANTLLSQTSEPLTGRSFHFPLYPLSQKELSVTESLLDTYNRLEERLIYGSYPEVVQNELLTARAQYLQTIIGAYLYKDVMQLEGIRNSGKIADLLRLIAYQVGQEVSAESVGRQLGMSKNTVEKYLDLLHQIYIIFPLRGFSGNLRKEVTKNKKWYFYDNGIRNALIGDFTPLSLRSDVGALWENYLIGERIKKAAYIPEKIEFYFWRTYDQQETDLVEKKGNQLFAFEIKWGKKSAKPPVSWIKGYPDANWILINQDNYLDWIL